MFMNEKEWVAYFETVNGRKPNAQEFTAAKAAGEFQAAQTAQQTVAQPQSVPLQAQQQQYQQARPSTFGWGVLGFFIPLVGLILFLVWKQPMDAPKGKTAGIGALIGVGAWILFYIIIIAIGAAIGASQPGY